ncbi:MAG: hypothetical protein JNK04_01050 [Myxococcales bacterium]|nr:hypothetical protein [Myxococcales bacterium]
MSEQGDDAEMDVLVGDAMGDLVPTSEAAVLRAEAEGVADVALPSSLARYRGLSDAPVIAPRTEVASLDEARARRAVSPRRIHPLVSHFGVALAGAAAAAAVLLAVRSTPNIGIGGDPPGSVTTSAAPAAGPIVFGDAESVCPSSCCAGKSCAKATGDMASCASGKSCISCSQADLAAGVYRFRVGGFAPAEKFKKNLSAGPLEVCLRVAGSEMVCGPSHTGGDPSKWPSLPLPVTGGDTLGGVTISVRFAGAKESLAEWSEPLGFNAGGLCKGYLIQPMFRTGEPLGTLSAFLVDSHFVELARGSSIAALKEERRRYQTPVSFSVFDTKAPGDRRFSLVLGPFGKAHAERVRRQALEAGANATPSLGDDFVGDAMPLD